jgi:Flp pilus assembly pilin Flp
MLWQDEDALTTVEYALLLSLVAIAAIGAWSQLGNPHIINVVNSATSRLPAS